VIGRVRAAAGEAVAADAVQADAGAREAVAGEAVRVDAVAREAVAARIQGWRSRPVSTG
jgi:hypothetical protein